jgi:predicted nucleic acid-binding protein
MPRMSAEFADTNVILYLLDGGPKADRAEALLAQGPRISVLVPDVFSPKVPFENSPVLRV